MIPEVFIQLLAWEFDTPDIRRFQLVQESLDRVTVRVVPQPGTQGYSGEARAGIEARISEILGVQCAVTFKLEDSIKDEQSGKYFYTVSKVAAAHA